MKPDVRFGVAHLYRTVVRSEGEGPPNFAGHLKLVTHGCGAGATCPLFVDLQSGHVNFVPQLEIVVWDDRIAEVPGIEDFRLVYRPDSRLLAAVGTRNERESASGVSMFEWRDNRLHLQRFVPTSSLCDTISYREIRGTR